MTLTFGIAILWAKRVGAQRSETAMLETLQENKEFDTIMRTVREKSKYDKNKINEDNAMFMVDATRLITIRKCKGQPNQAATHRWQSTPKQGST